MSADAEALVAERRFFDALLTADTRGLGSVLSDDFVLIDVVGGSEIPRQALLEAIGSGQLRFESVDVLDSRVRVHGPAAIVTGQTRMSGRFDGAPFAAHSRYTHVFIEQEDRWRLVAAQGTPIAGEAP